MNKIYLITRPEHDDTTHYLSKWSKDTISLAEEKGIKVLDLLREKAIKSEVESKLKKFSPNLVVFNGHGSEDIVTGHKNKELIRAGNNETLLKDKIVYAISCRSAKILGEKSVKAGTISYSGYDEDFIFVYDPNKITTPCGDSTAKLFLEHSQIFVESIIKGNTIEEAKKKAENILKENIKNLLGSNQDPSLVKYLWWDLKHFVSLGDLGIAI